MQARVRNIPMCENEEGCLVYCYRPKLVNSKAAIFWQPFRSMLLQRSDTCSVGAIGPVLQSTAWIYCTVLAEEWDYKFNKKFLPSLSLSWEYLCAPAWLGNGYGTEDDLEFLILLLLSQLLGKRMHHHTCFTFVVLETEHRASCVLAERSSNWAMSSAT